MSELSWVFHGSTAPKTAKDISRINKIHSGVWKRKPGTFSSVWEGKMTVVCISYFDTWARRVDLPYEEQTTPEQKLIGAETAEYFIQGFCDFWFPSFLQFIGRDIILTFIPPQCRRRQRMGEPNWVRTRLIKLVIKLYYDVHDYLLSDPTEPSMAYFREQLALIDLSTADNHIRKKRGWQDGFFKLFVLALGMVL
ncbi:unnamed protein product [Clonostachys rosea f. rosea IK726]|uniref:Uncharacterized protein n=1 Tax=Clonostachys rosea f. rosea IK726 TaxID=1349383 RepID=A0ACA9UP99_BIOOC|nr:unnamed protein product [Clonostachys rosea f. rosea IK726]